MYITGIRTTAAIDARNCELLWKHEWTPRAREGWSQNRGAAIKDGYLIRGTSDGYLLALNLENGRMIWARRAANSDIGEVFTMPPLIFEDKVLIGPAPSESGISGWVGAFRLTDGQPLWRFKTVPQAGDVGRNPGRIPATSNSVAARSGRPSRWMPKRARCSWRSLTRYPICRLTCGPATTSTPIPSSLSMPALARSAGTSRWYRTIPTTGISPRSVLYSTLTIGARDVKLVTTVGKDGILRTIDREKRSTLYETPVTTVENHGTPVTNKGVHACPGIMGGVEWNGPAYNPLTKMLYTPAVDWCGTFAASPDEHVEFVAGVTYLGGNYRADPTKRGWISAIDAVSGEMRWKYESPQPVVAAVTTTAGGVVFGGELTGHFVALDAKSGKVLHRFQTGGPIGGGLVSYEISGKQHIAVTSGRPSAFWWGGHAGSPTVFILTLP